MINPSRRAKFIWQCRRGMLELDLILKHFVENSLDTLSEEQLESFDKLLSCNDVELFSWLMGYEQPMDRELINIVEHIKLHHRA
ncbi:MULTISPECIES: succinate dehydrogenase assembly factor 2 [unclassified Legionella]|uniref:FAD assembly factor SdhE n=1 Tax=unclassified Legionella TaxID=2622702 RepID=UPI0010548F20|nr:MULTISPECIES: succinate dehydrogenase assembly factor 2 [unclassified Legionella]MDI9819453.1 succinate dehydrogenase assembly factor 2 [Legionella sp. PL877]